MWKNRISALLILIVAFGIGWFVAGSEPRLASYIEKSPLATLFANETVSDLRTSYPFKLGLDLAGGSRLVYKADVSKIPEESRVEAMASLRDVIERRVNQFGVGEPVITTESSFTGNEERLIVELPGMTNLDEAARQIGQTPLLQFKTVKENYLEIEEQNNKIIEARAQMQASATVGEDGVINIIATPELGMELVDPFITTQLGGAQLRRAQAQFEQQQGGRPQVVIGLSFNEEGAALFEKITGENIGRPIAIFLDGTILSIPTVNQKISGGTAVITGDFTIEEAKALASRLNAGALPVPVELIGSQLVGATLGEDSVQRGVTAALIGFSIVALFLILWYRLPGLLAVIALVIYVAIMLSFVKLIPIVLTAAGIAGFIISMGLAVDANVLIFERMKEEMRNGKPIFDAVRLGISRAWSSIKDSNTASLISAVILFWLGTSVVKGFAVTFGLGVLVSLFSALVITRILLLAVAGKSNGPIARFLFSNGFTSIK